MNPFRCIVVATDFSDTSKRAVDLAVDLAKQFGAKLVIAHCFEIPSYVYAGMMQAPVDLLGPIEEAAKTELKNLVVATQAKHADTHGELHSGIPADEILAIAKKQHADLIVVGTHGRRGVAHLVMGSVAEKVVRLSPIPVVTVSGKKG